MPAPGCESFPPVTHSPLIPHSFPIHSFHSDARDRNVCVCIVCFPVFFSVPCTRTKLRNISVILSLNDSRILFNVIRSPDFLPIVLNKTILITYNQGHFINMLSNHLLCCSLPFVMRVTLLDHPLETSIICLHSNYPLICLNIFVTTTSKFNQ